MVAGFNGLNIEEMRSLALEFDRQASELGSAAQSVTNGIHSVYWVGPFAVKFEATWTSVHRANLSKVEALLRDQAKTLRAQAQEQEDASSGSGGSSGGIPSLGNGSSKGPYDDGVLNVTVRLPGPVDTSDAAMQADDVSQGNAGDCWYMATLASLADTEAGRNLLRQNMVWDAARGGYFVTLYRNGVPERYFVDQTYMDGANGGNSWASVYEAALVQYEKSASGVNGGYGDKAMEILTGQDATRGGQDTDAARAALNSGGIVTTGSNPDYWIFTPDKMKVEGVPVQDADGIWRTRDIAIVRGHEYSIERVDANGDVYVRNPWGPGNNADGGGLIKLTHSQYEKYFSDQSVGSIR